MSVGKVAGSGGEAFDVTQRRMATPLAPHEVRRDQGELQAGADPVRITAEQEKRHLIEEVSEMLNESARWTHKRLRFLVHEETERMMVQVIDTETDEVIREIPPEEMLNLVARIHRMIGLLIDELA